MSNEPVTDITEIMTAQDEEYQRGLDRDQMRSNAEIIQLLQQREEGREEEQRLKRLETLNNLSPRSRRLFMIGEFEIESEEEQKYYNVTDSEADLIDPDYFLVYRLTDDAECAFSLVDLYESDCIKVTPEGGIDAITLPIEIDGDTFHYHVSPRFDNQWEYNVISMQLQPLLPKTVIRSPINTSDAVTADKQSIRESLKERLKSYGMDNDVISTACEIIATDEAIDNYQISEYNTDQILEKLVERTLEQIC